MRSTSLLLCLLGSVAFLLTAPVTMAQSSPAAPTLKSVLLEQLKTTHNQEDWFVPVKIAIAGLTPEQAAWKDETDNHSIAQLVNHLIFWNQQQLAKFKGEKPAAFSGTTNRQIHRFAQIHGHFEFKSDPKVCENLRNLWT